ncbi:MAG TPA: radical SAM family heme chaperone HemW [Candidatus Limnocylindria bacterium]|nr:radical SAM family heme chaperone HemW [Candidatus Limnocylindria bacterium]
MDSHIASHTAATPLDSYHLYIHVPFCRLVCAYCDFVTVGGRAADVPRYVAALHAELALRPAVGTLSTVYFGGGTPSLLPANAVAGLLDAAAARWGWRPAEATLEANPSAREIPDWASLRAAGVNRISLGAQSLRDSDLRTLARGHTADEVRQAFAAARRAGFDNVSLDLIYGIPGQTLAGWRQGLRAALALEPDHLSLYALQLAMEPDEWAAPPRPGALAWRRRRAAEQDDGLAADHYALAEELLDVAGYAHYELSSWTLPGRESRHNSAYWARRPYVGLGAGAHSFDGKARRAWNVRDLDRYLAAVEAGVLPEAGSELLDEPTAAFEAIALGLRRVEGLSRAAFAAEFGADPAARFASGVEAHVAAGLLEGVDDDRLRLTARGRLLASEVLTAFLPAAVA